MAKLTGGKFNAAPTQGGNLAAPEPAQHREDGRHQHPRRAHVFDKVNSLREVIGLHRFTLDLGRIDGIGGVAE